MNRSISMDRIKYIGFDMDYTLVGERVTHTVHWHTVTTKWLMAAVVVYADNFLFPHSYHPHLPYPSMSLLSLFSSLQVSRIPPTGI